MIDAQEFIKGCRKFGGTPTKHSEWDYRCVIGEISIGMNINGLVQVFDRRSRAINDITVKDFDRLDVEEDKPKMVFHSPTGGLEIYPQAYGIKIKTVASPGESDYDRFVHEKNVERFGRAKIKVPGNSILRMREPKICHIVWEVEKNEPVLIADGGNIVKGTAEDFKVSTHKPEFKYTDKKVKIRFKVGADLEYAKRKGPSYSPDSFKPPVCVPIGNACYSREHLYPIAEEIIGDPIQKPYGGILKEALERPPLNLEGFQSTNPDFEGVLRIVGEKGVNYIVYPIAFLPEKNSITVHEKW